MPSKLAVKLLMFALLAAAGCKSGPSIETWQRGVERYVSDRGDPNALRDVTVSGTRRGFAIIGGIDPKKTTDVNGVLLGHKTIDERPWFVYLVGRVDEQKVEEIRLAAVSFVNEKARWAMGQKDPKALSLYRHYNQGVWRQKHGTHAKPPASYTTFPRDADAFELAGEGTKVMATHPPSGAKWTLDVTKPATK